MSRRLFVAFVASIVTCGACGGGTPSPVVARSAPTDADACARFCAALRACGELPAQCEVKCGRDQRKLRPGFLASFVACIEDQAPPGGCEEGPGHKQRIAICHAATVEAYAKREGGEAMKKVIAAVCARRARCEGDAATNKACVDSLSAHSEGSSQSKTLSTANETLVASLAACVEARACDDQEPVASCQSPDDGPSL